MPNESPGQLETQDMSFSFDPDGPQLMNELSESFADYVWRHVSPLMSENAKLKVRERVRDLRKYYPNEMPEDDEIIKDLARSFNPQDVLKYCLGFEGLKEFAIKRENINVEIKRGRLLAKNYSGYDLNQELQSWLIERILYNIVRARIESELELEEVTNSKIPIKPIFDKWFKKCEDFVPLTLPTSTAMAAASVDPYRQVILEIRDEIQGAIRNVTSEVRKQGEWTREEFRTSNGQIVAALLNFKHFFKQELSDRLEYFQWIETKVKDPIDRYQEHDEFAAEYVEKFESASLPSVEPILEIDERLKRLAVHYGDGVFDKESLTFIAASEAIEEILQTESSDNVDYAISGIGLWKFAERELRMRFVNLLNNQGQEFFRTDEPSKWHRRINVNQDFNRIMLGTIQFALINHSKQALKRQWEPAEEYVKLPKSWLRMRHQLIRTIKRICNLRNSHAHTTKMSAEKYQELKEIIISGSTNVEPMVNWIINL